MSPEFRAGFTAEGSFAGILNSDFVQSLVNRALSGYEYMGVINSNCVGDADPYWLTIGPAQPADALLPLPVKFDVYTGPDIIFGNVRFQPDFWHSSRTTIQLRGNAMIVIGIQRNPLD